MVDNVFIAHRVLRVLMPVNKQKNDHIPVYFTYLMPRQFIKYIYMRESFEGKFM
jgi:hypothetical protein